MLMLRRARDSLKGATIGECKLELELLVTDFGEKKWWINFISWLFSFRRGRFEIS